MGVTCEWFSCEQLSYGVAFTTSIGEDHLLGRVRRVKALKQLEQYEKAMDAHK